MTNKKRFLMALTVVSFLTVTGLVIGCDSDDGPKVTPPAPSGGGSGTTPTRNTTAETQGREGIEATDNGTMIRNTGEVALNVRFAYDSPRHYRLNVNTAMPSDPASAGSAPARVACGVPATGRANGQCFNNDRSEIQSAPTPYEASGNGDGDNGNGDNGNGDNGNGDNGNGDNGNGDNGNGDNGGSGGGGSGGGGGSSLAATGCIELVEREGSLTFGTVRNSCGRSVVFDGACSTDTLRPAFRWRGVQLYRGGRFYQSNSALAPGATTSYTATCPSGSSFYFISCYGTSRLDVEPYWSSPSPTSSFYCRTG